MDAMAELALDKDKEHNEKVGIMMGGPATPIRFRYYNRQLQTWNHSAQKGL